MATIQQIYFTHCTQGTCALTRDTGEKARQVYGYSARASSLEPHNLRRLASVCDRFISYYLPSDFPSEDKHRLAPEAAPRRLFFVPDLDGLQVIGQVAYRAKDTANRPGSYFAHVLLQQKTDGPPWTPRAALGLWGAPGWRLADGPDIPWDLAPLADLKDLHGKGSTAMDEKVLYSYLTAPAQGPFHDPGKVIPPEWRAQPPDKRVMFFGECLRQFLEHGTLFLVAQPEFAALLQYGIFRLLPLSGFTADLSFSTYETELTRTNFKLIATTFHKPTDADPEAIQPSSTFRAVLNTFHPPTVPPIHKDEYAGVVLNRFPEKRRKALDQLLDGFGAADPTQPRELVELLSAHHELQTLAEHGTPLRINWRGRPKVRQYLGEQIDIHFSGAQLEERLARIRGKQPTLDLLELLQDRTRGGNPSPLVQRLLQDVGVEQLSAVLAMPALAPETKVALLARAIEPTGKMPEACWQYLGLVPPGRSSNGRLSLESLLTLLPTKPIQLLGEQVPVALRRTWWHALASVGRQDEHKLDLLRAELRRYVEGRTGDSIYPELKDGEILDLLSFDPPARNEALRKILNELPASDGSTEERIAFLRRNEECLRAGGEADENLGALELLVNWQKAIKHLKEIDRLPERQFAESTDSIKGACEGLVAALYKLAPREDYTDAHRQELLDQLAREIQVTASRWNDPDLSIPLARLLEGRGWSRRKLRGRSNLARQQATFGNLTDWRAPVILTIFVIAILISAFAVKILIQARESPQEQQAAASASSVQNISKPGNVTQGTSTKATPVLKPMTLPMAPAAQSPATPSAMSVTSSPESTKASISQTLQPATAGISAHNGATEAQAAARMEESREAELRQQLADLEKDLASSVKETAAAAKAIEVACRENSALTCKEDRPKEDRPSSTTKNQPQIESNDKSLLTVTLNIILGSIKGATYEIWTQKNDMTIDWQWKDSGYSTQALKCDSGKVTLYVKFQYEGRFTVPLKLQNDYKPGIKLVVTFKGEDVLRRWTECIDRELRVQSDINAAKKTYAQVSEQLIPIIEREMRDIELGIQKCTEQDITSVRININQAKGKAGEVTIICDPAELTEGMLPAWLTISGYIKLHRKPGGGSPKSVKLPDHIVIREVLLADYDENPIRVDLEFQCGKSRSFTTGEKEDAKYQRSKLESGMVYTIVIDGSGGLALKLQTWAKLHKRLAECKRLAGIPTAANDAAKSAGQEKQP